MSASGWLAAHVAAVAPLTVHSRSLLLDVPGWPGNLAGQHLDVRLTAEDGYQAERSYSVASVGTGTTVELAVDEIVDGEVSPYLVRDIRPGDFLEVKGPLGAYFVWRGDEPAPVQLIAGGSGIVPLLAMVRAHAASANEAPFRLLYSTRSPADAMYADDLLRLSGPLLAIDWVYTRATPDGWPRPAGRVRLDELAQRCVPPEQRPLVYVCGPTAFVETVADALVQIGHAPQRVRTERFGGAA